MKTTFMFPLLGLFVEKQDETFPDNPCVFTKANSLPAAAATVRLKKGRPPSELLRPPRRPPLRPCRRRRVPPPGT